MIKKLGALACTLVLALGLCLIYSKPVFYGYSTQFEVYLNSSSSQAQIVEASALELFFLNGVEGESATLNAEQFDLQNFLDSFCAKVKLVERLEQVTCYYAYSPKIRYQKLINGEKVNLHIAVRNSAVKVGSPLIFGSF